MTTQIGIPDFQDLAVENDKLIVVANALQVVTHEHYLEAADYGKRMKIAQNNLKARFKDSKQKAKAAHAAICDLENSLLRPLMMAEAHCDSQVKTYLQAEQRRQREENDRRQKEAEEQARVDAEKKRLANEEERLKTAELLESQGFKEEADAVLAQDHRPAPVVPVVLAPDFVKPKAAGISLRDNWKAVIVDPIAFVKEIADGRQPIGLLFKVDGGSGHYTPTDAGLQGLAKALKAELNIPGVRPFNDQGVTKRVGGAA